MMAFIKGRSHITIIFYSGTGYDAHHTILFDISATDISRHPYRLLFETACLTSLGLMSEAAHEKRTKTRCA